MKQFFSCLFSCLFSISCHFCWQPPAFTMGLGQCLHPHEHPCPAVPAGWQTDWQTLTDVLPKGTQMEIFPCCPAAAAASSLHSTVAISLMPGQRHSGHLPSCMGTSIIRMARRRPLPHEPHFPLESFVGQTNPEAQLWVSDPSTPCPRLSRTARGSPRGGFIARVRSSGSWGGSREPPGEIKSPRPNTRIRFFGFLLCAESSEAGSGALAMTHNVPNSEMELLVPPELPPGSPAHRTVPGSTSRPPPHTLHGHTRRILGGREGTHCPVHPYPDSAPKAHSLADLKINQ